MIINNGYINRLQLIANLVLSGFANDEYKNLSKEDKEIVDIFVQAKKNKPTIGF